MTESFSSPLLTKAAGAGSTATTGSDEDNADSSLSPPLTRSLGAGTAIIAGSAEERENQPNGERALVFSTKHGEEEYAGDCDSDDDPPICRFCLDERWVPDTKTALGTANKDGRLISPCLCSGSIRFVHVGCLNKWRRSGHAMSDSLLRCGQCKYRYNVRYTSLGIFVLGDRGVPTMAVLVMLTAMHVLGALILSITTPQVRENLYHWLLLDIRYEHAANTAYGEILMLGGGGLGCLFLALYTTIRMLRKWFHLGGIGQEMSCIDINLIFILFRNVKSRNLAVVGLIFAFLGRIKQETFYIDAFLLLFSVHNEMMQYGPGFSFAVLGLIIAYRYLCGGAINSSKYIAQWLGETFLEPTPADRRRHSIGLGL